MKVKMLTSMAGRDFSLSPGDEHDFTDGEADRLIAAGFCEAVEAKQSVKRAGGKKFETAAKAGDETRG